MGFFESKQESKKQEKAVHKTTSPDPVSPSVPSSFNGTLIGKTMKIDGDLSCREDVLVEGTVIGKLTSQASIVVGTSGTIRAKVGCKGITVRGEVTGNVDAKESVIIESTGKLKGDISTKSLNIEPGGFFEGFSKMLSPAPGDSDSKKKDEPERKPNQAKEAHQNKSSEK